MTRLILALSVAASVGAACTHSQGGAPRGRDDVITADELESVSASNLHQAIERLRPLWLRREAPRSVNIPTEIAVILDGHYFGDVESLRGISPLGIRRIELLDGASAVAAVPRVGTGRHVEAAIVIESRQ